MTTVIQWQRREQNTSFQGVLLAQYKYNNCPDWQHHPFSKNIYKWRPDCPDRTFQKVPVFSTLQRGRNAKYLVVLGKNQCLARWLLLSTSPAIAFARKQRNKYKSAAAAAASRPVPPFQQLTTAGWLAGCCWCCKETDSLLSALLLGAVYRRLVALCLLPDEASLDWEAASRRRLCSAKCSTILACLRRRRKEIQPAVDGWSLADLYLFSLLPSEWSLRAGLGRRPCPQTSV